MKKVLSMLLVCVMLVGALAGLNVFAAGEASIEIVSHNVNIGETINLMYAVTTENADDLDITVEVTVDGDTYTCEEKADDTYGTVYVAPKGVAPYDIAKEYTAVAKLSNGATSDPDVYSVLEYLNERKYVSVNNPNPEKVPTAEQLALYDSLLDYAEKLDAALDTVDAKLDTYTYVIVDGVSAGMKTTAYTPVSTKVPADGEVVMWSVTDANGNPLTDPISDEDMQANGYELNAPVVFFTSYVEAANAPKTLATFTFGDNKDTTTHVDGSDLGASKTYTEGDYTLALTGMSKVYGPANDATGISCIKLGTSSAVGTFTFTVPENVTSVVIRVAGYKAKTSKIAINGGAAQTLTTSSDDGAYQEFVIDTSTNKTVTVATVSGAVRAMVDSIAYIGLAN